VGYRQRPPYLRQNARAGPRDEPPTDFIETQDIIAAWVEDYNKHQRYAGQRSIEPANTFVAIPNAA
jgi:hypothetical protein